MTKEEVLFLVEAAISRLSLVIEVDYGQFYTPRLRIKLLYKSQGQEPMVISGDHIELSGLGR